MKSLSSASRDLVTLLGRNARDIGWIINIFLLASIILYGYYGFFSPGGISYIYRNWDGPGYVVVAKTFYNVPLINKINPFPFLNATHYAFQLPLYPLFIRLFSFIGYNESMIFVSQLFALLFSIALYFLIKMVNPKANALMVAILSIFYTPRWFIVSHVGSTEPQMLFFITLFMIFFLRKKYLPSATALALAQLSKPQGIVFFVGIALYYTYEILITRKKTITAYLQEFAPYLLIPLTLLGIFILYYISYGNFYVFFGDDVFFSMKTQLMAVLTAKDILNFPVGFWTVWKEAIVYTYILYFIPIILLFEKKLYIFGIVALVYFLSVLSIIQTDIARYIIPLLPFFFLGYAEALSKKPVYIALFICIPAVFLFSVGYINYNLAPLPFY